MKRIEKILEYNFSEYEKNCLIEAEMINGCGGKGGIDFDSIVDWAFKKIPSFNVEKFDQLRKDFKKICHEHDLDFRLKRGFIKSNYKMAKKSFLLLKNWAGTFEALAFAVGLFSLLQKYGKKYYFTK